jgi:hypothetical protein
MSKLLNLRGYAPPFSFGGMSPASHPAHPIKVKLL